jgi:hypothetical protein
MSDIILCPRCFQPCRISGSDNVDARLMKRADSAKHGLCPNCAITSFILDIETFRINIEKIGPGLLLEPRFQHAFAELLKIGKADAKPEEIDWKTVVENWSLPFPGKKAMKAGSHG